MFRLMATLLLVLVSISFIGCGGGGGSVSSFHPKVSVAKQALTAALEAWKSGQAKPGTIANQKPGIEVQDSVWDSGRKLKGFQIGDEQPAADGPPRFSVELTFDGEPATEKADYVVVGKDPLWVMRENDFQKMSGQ